MDEVGPTQESDYSPSLDSREASGRLVRFDARYYISGAA